MRRYLFLFLFLPLLLFVYSLGVTDVSAQTCPHAACGSPGMPCCYGSRSIDEIIGCQFTGVTCDEQYNNRTISCDGGSCQTASVCSSNDSCTVLRDPSTNIPVGCAMPSSCSAASCCGPGVVPGTSTPTPTSAPPPPTNTPVPPTPSPIPCQVTTSPSTRSLVLGGGGQNISASVTSGLGSATVTNMAFGSYNTGIATVNPANDSTSTYNTTVSPVSVGVTAVWATATLSDGRTCPSTAATDTDVTVAAPTSTITPTPTAVPTPSPVPCQVTTSPSTRSLVLGGGGQNISASVTSGLGSATVTNMAFGSYNTGIATVNPANDSTSTYNTTVSPVSVGVTAVWATATLSDGRTCPSTAATDTDVTVAAPTSTVTPSPTPVPCQVTTNPASISLSVGGSGLPVTASVTSGLGGATVTNMAFGSYNTSFATVNPANDATSIYQTTVSPVAAGSTAVWATATLSDGRTCQSTAATDTDVSVTAASCTITLSGTYNPGAGATVSVNPVTTVSGGTISQVAFTVGNSAFATVCANGTGPCPVGSGSYTDPVTAFNADLTGQNGGATTLTAVATMNTGSTCTSNVAAVNVSNASGWWQVISGDIIAGNAGGGSIQSTIPITCVLASCNPVLIKNNTAGFSGVPSTGTGGAGAVNTGTGTPSTANWRATGAGFLSLEGYNYIYFERKIPVGVTPTAVSGPSVLPTVFESGGAEYPAGSGYFWYQYNNASDLNISGGDGSVDLANRKVILFVRGANVTLSTKVSLNDGVGAFYLFAERDITVAETVGDAPTAVSTPDIEGVLFAGDQIIIPTAGSSNDPQLHIRGAVVGLGTNGVNDGIDPNRLLSNNGIYPAEVFEFGPDLIMNWPKDLTRRTLQWREVAP